MSGNAFERTIRRTRHQRDIAIAILPDLELRAKNKAEEVKSDLAKVAHTYGRSQVDIRANLNELGDVSDIENVRLTLDLARTKLLNDPDDADAHYVAGLSLLAMGERDAAKDELLLVMSGKNSDLVRLASAIVDQL
jgi:thioredoxin-like negative regulator of GroEL